MHRNSKIFLLCLAASAIITAIIIIARFRDPYLFSKSQIYHGDYLAEWEGQLFAPDTPCEIWRVASSPDLLEGCLYPFPGDPSGAKCAARFTVEAKLGTVWMLGNRVRRDGNKEIKIIRVINHQPLAEDTFDRRFSEMRQNAKMPK